MVKTSRFALALTLTTATGLSLLALLALDYTRASSFVTSAFVETGVANASTACRGENKEDRMAASANFAMGFICWHLRQMTHPVISAARGVRT